MNRAPEIIETIEGEFERRQAAGLDLDFDIIAFIRDQFASLSDQEGHDVSAHLQSSANRDSAEADALELEGRVRAAWSPRR